MKTNSLSDRGIKKLSLVVLFVTAILAVNAQTMTLKVGDKTRSMFVYAPDELPQNRPLLISMHGMNQDVNYQKSQAKFELIADTAKFVVVYPQGEGNAWDIGGMKDINFIVAIIDKMHEQHNIDRNSVYLSGFSMGGMMTYYAATKIADKIAAFAPVGGYLMSGPNTNSSRPIPLIHIHGTSDDVCVYSAVQSHIDAWVKRNGCWTRAVTTQPYPKEKPGSNATYKVWKNGEGGVEVALISLEGAGHWHSNNPNGVYSNEEIWNFCKRYSLPSASSIDNGESVQDATIISEEHYNLLGQQVPPSAKMLKGMYVVKSHLSDGNTVTDKVYID